MASNFLSPQATDLGELMILGTECSREITFPWSSSLVTGIHQNSALGCSLQLFLSGMVIMSSFLVENQLAGSINGI